MECRAVLQMDQAASTHKIILWYFRKCHIHANMDCHMHISAFGLCKEGNAYRPIVTYHLKKCRFIPYGQDPFK